MSTQYTHNMEIIAHIDLRNNTWEDTKVKALDWVLEHNLRKNPTNTYMGIKIGDTIEFNGGYNNDIRYTSTVIGIDDDGNFYVIWDCYWLPIRPTDKSRDLLKVC